MRAKTLVCCLCAVLMLAGVTPAALWAAEEEDSALSLDEAYAQALIHNNQVRSSREQVRQAEQGLNIATSQLLPQMNARAERTRQKTTPIFSRAGDYGLLTVSASQHLYQGGKYWNQRSASLYSLQSQQFRHFRRLQSILFTVAAQYYEALLAEENIVIAENQTERALHQLELAQNRYEVGLVNKTAVYRAEVQVTRAREQLERAKNQRALALENLRLEMGVDDLSEKLKGIQPKRLEAVSPEVLRKRGLERRRDLQQLAGTRQAAAMSLEAEKGDYWPRFSVEGAYSKTNEEDLYFGETEDWNISLVATYPLFTGFRDESEVKQARHRKSEIEAEYRRLERTVSTEIRSVYLDLKTQEKVIDSLEQEVKSATANYEQIVAQFNEGLVTAVDVVDAQTALNEAERRLSLAFYNYQLNLLRLRLATGTFEQERVSRYLKGVAGSDTLHREGDAQ